VFGRSARWTVTALAALLLLVVPATASARQRSFEPVRQGPHVAVFKLSGVKPAAVRSARVKLGSKVLALRTARVRKAARRQALRIHWRKLAPRAHRGRRGHGARRVRVRRPRLTVVTRRVVAPVPAGTPIPDSEGMLGSFESNSFDDFDGHSAENGAIEPTSERAYDGSRSARASYDGSGGNGFARTWFEVDFKKGSDIWYGGAYYIPSKKAMPCWYSLMRWDNYITYGSGGDVGGIEISTSGRARLMREDYSAKNYAVLSKEFDLPEGRWFWLEVHQRLSDQDGQALNEVFLDGRRVDASTTANGRGRVVNEVRHGLVALAGECAPKGSIYLDRASVSSRMRGPLS
jgi:hypothetical protein